MKKLFLFLILTLFISSTVACSNNNESVNDFESKILSLKLEDFYLEAESTYGYDTIGDVVEKYEKLQNEYPKNKNIKLSTNVSFLECDKELLCKVVADTWGNFTFYDDVNYMIMQFNFTYYDEKTYDSKGTNSHMYMFSCDKNGNVKPEAKKIGINWEIIELENLPAELATEIEVVEAMAEYVD